MDPFILQIILAAAMFIATVVCGFIPIKVVKILGEREGHGGKWLSLLSCFSGGVFLATCFLDVVPHINGLYAKFEDQTHKKSGFPWPQMFTCVGFFLVYLIEEVCLRLFSVTHDHDMHSSTSASPLEVSRKESIRSNTMEKVMEEAAFAVTHKPRSFLKSITFAVAISFHSLLEGFALGVQDSPGGIVTLFLSLLLHKCIEAFSVGLQVSKGHSDKLKAVLGTILIYAFMTPLGSLMGAILQDSQMELITKEGVVLILESMAAGTFIYVTFLEVLAQEKGNGHDNLLQLLFIVCGFSVIAVLQYVFGHDEASHSHVHGHTHEPGDFMEILLTSTVPNHS